MLCSGFDFNCDAAICHPARNSLAGCIDEHRQAGIRADHGASATHDIWPLRSALRGEHKVKSFSCFDQFLCMAFAQLTYRESLRDIETCLRAHEAKLYHVGFRGRIARNTLADANQSRLAHLRRLRPGAHWHRAPAVCRDPLGVDQQTVYAFDSTTIDLCLSSVSVGAVPRRKGAVKLHTLLDLRGNIPTFIHISARKNARCRPCSTTCRSSRGRSTSWTAASRLRASVPLHQARGASS